MIRDCLRKHCEAMCKKFENVPTSGTYEEHKLVLDLLNQTEWIPVSERLPEKDGEYLLWGKVIEDEENYIFIGDFDSCAEAFGYWQDYYDPSTLGYVGGELLKYASVIAWMPLPEPYKEGESE